MSNYLISNYMFLIRVLYAILYLTDSKPEPHYVEANQKTGLQNHSLKFLIPVSPFIIPKKLVIRF